jgi:hypothetical protein
MRNAMDGRTRTTAELRGGRSIAAAASLLTVLALGPSAGAQDGADAPAAPPDAADSAAAETPAPAAPRESDQEESAPPPRSAGNASDDVFVPTEEIAADEEVVFPVDI